jgi:hypothetical protein
MMDGDDMDAGHGQSGEDGIRLSKRYRKIDLCDFGFEFDNLMALRAHGPDITFTVHLRNERAPYPRSPSGDTFQHRGVNPDQADVDIVMKGIQQVSQHYLGAAPFCCSAKCEQPCRQLPITHDDLAKVLRPRRASEFP